MVTATVTSKGQIVIPSKIRQHFNIKKGTRLCIIEKHNEIVLQPLTAEYFGKIAGIAGAKGKGVSALLEERAKEKKNEEKKWSKF